MRLETPCVQGPRLTVLADLNLTNEKKVWLLFKRYCNVLCLSMYLQLSDANLAVSIVVYFKVFLFLTKSYILYDCIRGVGVY